MSKFISAFFVALLVSASAVSGQTVANGHYYGSTLLCDNGYGNVGGQCVVVADIPTHSSVASGACAENGSCAGDISEETGRPKTVPVDGYYRKDGTYVRGHYRSTPSKSRSKK